MNREVRDNFWVDLGPVSVDSNRLGPELIGLGAIMVMLLIFRWIYKRI